MTLKKTLSLLLAVLLVVSAAAFAMAESTETTSEEEAVAADTGDAAVAETYTLNDMLTQAMADAYTRQAAYAAYTEAYPDSKSITGIDMDTQIVLLEMLLKANDVALPTAATDVTVPETKTEAYEAIAAAETDAYSMYKTFLTQESLTADAQIIFQSVQQAVKSNAATFTAKATSAKMAEAYETAMAEQQAQMEELMSSDNVQVYVVNDGRGRGTRTVYVYSNSTTDEATDEAEAADEADAETTETTDNTAEDGVSD